ncbi:DNA-directed RNA polymerase subunit alpha C-terminal domain-containing protein [Clostridium perfringens]|uniref:DNA-directed RNA polymerase subunit alpha C-terminal domain-containing protein n=2 Tax=Clostridium perfringens TaxID=1502 RepID=UPI0006690CEC|nr:DNA-directed RNA polymerase subunit alpha C-terminal domain-containing protein [Clostridium perfringens]EJT6168020.1 hypothetical protein [Clostridium perfringens]EJT6622152.1 hypothetical protein [Clostridium perfringens]MBX9098523.1 hypothetical protein [Clostridium perfringens]MDB2047539.1 sigma factor-like helix-turn-helix DNA-binding protein [Clostridium perfringens]MDK0581620.1 DNA-directed RNA polymerase subunit alpha C-terminal domain-containing protein [Clostridium perfringens]
MNEVAINETDIKVLNLSVRAYNSLKAANINTIFDLIQLEPEDLIKIKNLGAKTLNEIINLKDSINKGEYLYGNLEDGIDSSLTMLDFIKEKNREIKEIIFFDNFEGYVYNIEVKSMNLSVRSKNALLKNSFDNLVNLLEVDMETFYNIKNLGDKSKREILDEVKRVTHIIYSDSEEEVLKINNDFKFLLNDYENSSMSYNKILLKSKLSLAVKKLNDSKEDKLDYINYIKFDKEFFKNLIKYNLVDFLKKRDTWFELNQIKELFPSHFKESDIIEKSLNELIISKKVEKDGDFYRIHYPTLIEYLNSIDDDRNKEILINRLQGNTLLETGEKLGITRERVRQIEKKAMSKIVRIREDDFKEIFEKYEISEEAMKNSFDVSKEVYNYLNYKYIHGATPFEEILNDVNVSQKIRLKAEKYIYRNYLDIGNIRVKKDRQSILDYILKNYCKDDVDVNDLSDIYEMFLDDYGLENDESLKYQTRYFENRLSSSNKVLWKFKKKLRYYNLESIDKAELIDRLNLAYFEDVEYSTLKFFRDNLELMNEWDIRDEYELHNLMKKVIGVNNDLGITFLRMPNVSFGNPDRDMQSLELLIQLAPISNIDLAKAYENEYGVRAETALANYFKEIDEYFHNGIYSIEYEQLDSDEFNKLKGLLVDKIYTIKDIKLIYKKYFNKKDTRIINPYNLKRLGFKVTSMFVYKEEYLSVEDCLKNIILSNNIFKSSSLSPNIYNSSAYYNITQNLKQNFEIIEIEPSVFLNTKTLNNIGIGKEKFIEFIDYIDSMVDDEVFTIKYLREKGMAHSLDDLGFEDYFLSSIIASDSKFRFRKVGRTMILRKSKTSLTMSDLIEQIVYDYRKIDIYDLIDFLRETYGIRSEKHKILEMIREKDLYYDEIMEKVYIDYDEYFEEI